MGTHIHTENNLHEDFYIFSAMAFIIKFYEFINASQMYIVV